MNKNTKPVKTNEKRETKILAPKAARTKTQPVSATAFLTASKTVAPGQHGNQVSLEFLDAEATQVCVAGTFNAWKPEASPLKSVGRGRWVGVLELRPGRHEYLFVADGKWMPDPNACEAVRNPYGGSNSVLMVK